jgi:hypothetical protein
MDAAQKQFNDTFLEQQRESRNENIILKLKSDLREQGVYIMKLTDTTPVILNIKKISDENEKKFSKRSNGKR